MEMTLGKRIAMLRRRKELKQEELANMLDITAQAVSKWENDQTCPDISLLPELAQILGVSVDELLTGKQEFAPAVQLVPETQRKDLKDMILRLVVDSAQGDKVRLNLPMALVLAALDIAPAVQLVPETQRKDLKDMILRLVVDSAQGDKVRLNLPMALVLAALDMGVSMPQISGNEAMKNVDLRQIVELVRQGAVGNLVEVESSEGDVVRVFVE